LFGHQTGHNSSKLSKLFKEPLTNWQIVATRLEQHHQKQSVIHGDSILRLGLVQFRSVMTGETKGIGWGKRESSGRKRKYVGSESRQKSWNSQHKRIYLLPNVFHAWRGAKIEAGYSACSDSDFAAHLLSLEYRR
jgi:hypothetical protein